ncbi:MAG TPA: DegT/DnrJ/EryC1/StrS aminotransferase family protein [Accumulibacter sp.]|uniref:DegT/DnrJ/EryC1/StrS family aminotransferase n=1 Tax=Accumulibacter sp. TaxID=2053492 RepID=UPI0025D9C1A7|nr:DegT/DnrJ/EryC1/StrS aminotransferase family protein [Accumulibacter sp.]MCM8598955.1 DegT/DnrJ/EryC1/StrS aminotransferase family protein [Accumulibacter sp.]MCM8662354.1 DegT/DnrJ/EryC1/StrS aminotransferase family protein [Accumulibacter sp.]HNC52350.1 DegT/DnrJ/EryC1/StrS aminotransferase family protein [Accumulibacter sp.]
MEFLPFTRPDIDDETIAAVADVLRSGWLTTGPKCRELEAALSLRAGGRPVRLANSATAALEMALRIAGIQSGDEVITTSLSWVATSNVILAVGATPVFVDIDPTTRLIDLDLVDAVVTPRTRAIVPVDLAGFPVDRDRLYELAGRHRLRVIEDAAQSQGARWRGRELGSFGDLVAFSFHPNKNMTTGEGGCLVMNSEEEAGQFEKLRLQGVTRFADGTYDCDLLGGKANLTDIAAAIGLGQLRRLDQFNERRRELARQYFVRLAGLPLELPPSDFEHGNWHMFQVLLPAKLAEQRGELIRMMRERGIALGVHYPAIHRTSLYARQMSTLPHLPHTESVAARILTLPLFPAMHDSDIERVTATLTKVLGCLLSGKFDR